MNNWAFIELNEKYIIAGKVCDDELFDLYIFDRINPSIVGNIYRGRLLDRINGLNAFFVDIGETSKGFFQLEGHEYENFNEGDEIILQAISNEDGDKGPKLTNKYELKGVCFILTPFNKNRNYSKKIKNPVIKERINMILNDILPENIGCVVRTSVVDSSENELRNELIELLNKHKQLIKEKNFNPTPKLLLENNYFNNIFSFENLETIITNNNEIFNKLIDLKTNNKIKLIEDFKIKDDSKIFNQIKKIFKRKLTLENGIELVFDHTEALSVIDVNSKGFTRQGKGETYKNINESSVKDIIKHIHIRNICGIILIDFVSSINNKIDKEQEKRILEIIYSLSKDYKNPVNIVGFTKLGILELTRNKKVNNLNTQGLSINIF